MDIALFYNKVFELAKFGTFSIWETKSDRRMSLSNQIGVMQLEDDITDGQHTFLYNILSYTDKMYEMGNTDKENTFYMFSQLYTQVVNLTLQAIKVRPEELGAYCSYLSWLSGQTAAIIAAFPQIESSDVIAFSAMQLAL